MPTLDHCQLEVSGATPSIGWAGLAWWTTLDVFLAGPVIGGRVRRMGVRRLNIPQASVD